MGFALVHSVILRMAELKTVRMWFERALLLHSIKQFCYEVLKG